MKLAKKKELAQKRRWRIRKKVRGTADRPRLTVRFTNKNVHAQCIDDEAARTLVALSTNEKDLGAHKPNVEGASQLGKTIGERAKAAGISVVVFDRAARKYHGCVKAFAEGAREAGLTF